jgi:hypothetical protein
VRRSFRAMPSTRFRKMLNHGHSLRVHSSLEADPAHISVKTREGRASACGRYHRVRFRMPILIVNTNNWGDLYHAGLQNFKQ